ncbi:type ISP restriction/modification enzyme [Spirillospora sp. NPDC052242]
MGNAAANRILSVDTAAPTPNSSAALANAVSAFGAAVQHPLAAGLGGEEYQIQDPVAQLVRAAGNALGLPVTMHKEVSLSDLLIRPDFAVDLAGGRVGYIEVKAPSKSISPKDWPARSHDRLQWQKLSLLPNVLLSTGQCFALYRDGVRVGPVARLEGALDRAGRALRPADAELARVLHDFLTWAPDPPHDLRTLVRTAARLCRYLREEVLEVLEHERLKNDRPFTTLAEEWRSILFPRMTEPADFADSYAQTITFALLLARAAGVSFEGNDLPSIGRQLGKRHALIGKALGVLSDPAAADNLMVVETLRRVIGAVDWGRFDHADINAHALLYEVFLSEYDAKLRRLSGSYYTPDRLAAAMVSFTDLVLKKKLERPEGYASDDVIVVDPAMGTGTFLVEIVRAVVRTVVEAQGDATEQRLRDLFQKRLIGFERQVTPYAVAELRLHDLLREYGADVPPQEMRFLADTFDDPDKQEIAFGQMYAELQKQREGANKVKRDLPVMAIVGNPPYLDRAHTRDPAPWVEDRRDPGRPDSLTTRPSLDEFRQRGKLDYKLAATWVFYWRWAIWKAFEAHPDDPAGLIAFITPSSYLSGAAFAGMRSHLRKVADEGWIIDVSPEGHQPPVPTRLFPKVQQPLAIAVFVRYADADPRTPARIHYRNVTGIQEQKLTALESLEPDTEGWELCPDEWKAEFRPTSATGWHTAPSLAELLPWQTPGVRTKRTWVIAPSAEVLERRWTTLVNSRPEDRTDLMKVTRDRDLDTMPAPIPNQPHPGVSLRQETTRRPNVVPFAYRSFDRQYLLLDPRVVDFASPDLWRVSSDEQVYASEQHTNVLSEGVALTFTALVPDMHHFQGHHGGRVLPLYRDVERTANVTPGLSLYLSDIFEITVTDEDVFAYIAAVAAHSGYTRRFSEQLVNPGLRIPLTRDATLWGRAVELGRTVVWLHTRGTRFADETEERPLRAPRLPDAERPRIERAIPYRADCMPDGVGYDEQTWTLLVGDEGRVAPVPASVWAYNVGGMRVVKKWVGYRLRHPRRRKAASRLDLINAEHWTSEFNNDLLDLLHVLGLLVRLEPAQDALLGEICSGSQVTVADLRAAALFPVPKTVRGSIKPSGRGGQLVM